MARLAVFDIDGTLTDTNTVDDECFLRAVADVLDVDVKLLDWSGAPHVTDSDLLRWFAEQHCGRALRSGESDAVIDRFLALLRDQLAAAPERFRAVGGAPLVFDALRQVNWRVALATGGWTSSAHLKFKAIAHDPTTEPLASASDAMNRFENHELARERAAAKGETLDRTVSIGDGVWDVRAAADLGWPFVGIGTGDRARRLRDAGATTILPDLTDIAALCAALESAPVPR